MPVDIKKTKQRKEDTKAYKNNKITVIKQKATLDL